MDDFRERVLMGMEATLIESPGWMKVRRERNINNRGNFFLCLKKCCWDDYKWIRAISFITWSYPKFMCLGLLTSLLVLTWFLRAFWLRCPLMAASDNHNNTLVFGLNSTVSDTFSFLLFYLIKMAAVLPSLLVGFAWRRILRYFPRSASAPQSSP